MGYFMNSKLSDYQKRMLLKNKHVEKITESHVVFTSEFKRLAVEATFKGQPIEDFFIQEGIKLNYFKSEYAKNCLKRWRKRYLEEGREALEKDDRGKGATGRPSTKGMTYEELAEIVRIQQLQIDYAKKLHAQRKKDK